MVIPARLRIILIFPALVALLCGVLSGLARLGVPLPDRFGQLLGVHGALMVCGFFGTVIGLERAVALARGWPYLAPLCSGWAALLWVWHPDSMAAQGLAAGASLIMASACGHVWRRQREAHHATLAAGALSWLLGNLVWIVKGSLVSAVPLWAAFLILTIAGERLELSRFIPTPPLARRSFAVIVGLLLLGAQGAAYTDLALRAFAIALLLLAAWLLRYDIARRTCRSHGMTRYMAICLLSGYVWLGIAAGLGLAGALTAGNPLRDAALHALMLGFVVAMVFGHAPIILPAVSRLKMRWHPGFYLPLLLLHGTLVLRVVAGLAQRFPWRQGAALGNALALLLFVLIVLESIVAMQRRNRA